MSYPTPRRPSPGAASVHGSGAHGGPAGGSSSSSDDVLAQSLRQLSLSAGTGTPAKAPSPLARTPAANGRTSRAGTPALLRKTSTASLHSVASSSPSTASAKGPLRRTSSTNLRTTPVRSPLLLPSSGGGGGGGLLGLELKRPARPPPPTAAEVAGRHFAGELARHAASAAAASADAPETVVVFHDACYGHRFARPRTSRANLVTIVERPERIQACAVGVAAAYVRLGGRHADGAYMPHPRLDPEAIPAAAVPFRIHKTARALPLLSPAVTNVHGTRWMEELRILCDAAEAKLALTGRELQRPDMDRGPPDHHAPPARLHEGDLYLCAESLQALEGALGAVCEAVDTVFAAAGAGGRSNRRAFVAVRPPGHHCSADWPSGFCWINNVHVGIMHAMLAHGLTHAAIVDFDLHHGDGSQAIAWQHNARGAAAAKNAAAWKKTSIGYFSLHDINSFPCEAGDEDKVKNASLCIENAHGQTVWNVHLEPWKTEAAFWALYARKYAVLLDKLRAFLRAQAAQREAPRAAVFISAGFDASEWETSSMQRHKVNVPTEFYARFTRDVVQIADEECAGRVVSVLEGGYSDRALVSGVLSHVSGLAAAGSASDPAAAAGASTTPTPSFPAGLGYEMGRRLGALDGDPDPAAALSYDPAWWASAELDRIEAALAPPPPSPAADAKASSNRPSTTYSSPTQASQARVVATPTVRRSMGSLSAAYGASAPPTPGSPASRPPSPSPPPPPPPEVPWTVAMHELSKLLIPTDRTTTSCTIEDLSAEATRARRDRQALLQGELAAAAAASTPATPSGPTRVSLRERKPVKPFGASKAAAASGPAIKEEDRELDRKNRRKTVAGVSTTAAAAATATAPLASSATPAPRGKPNKPTARRLSAASTAAPKDDEAADLPLPPLPPMPPLRAAPPSSNGPSTRPASAHSSTATRPESSMSAATTAATTAACGGGGGGGGGPPAARKARPAAGSATPAKTPRGRKAAVAGTAAAAVQAASTASATRKPSSSARRGSSGGSTDRAAGSATAGPRGHDDVDKLTSGMRKIKINVVTAAQKEARAQAKRKEEEEAAAAAARVARQPEQQPQTMCAPATPTVPHAAMAVDPRTPLAQTTAASSTDGGDTGDDDGLVHGTAPPTVFIPYQPEGAQPQPQPQPTQQRQHLHWLPPNEVSTPVAAAAAAGAASGASPSPMKRADLPVFTAASTIPFAGWEGRRAASSASSRPSSSGVSAGGGGGGGLSSRPPSSGLPDGLGTPVLGPVVDAEPPASPRTRPRSPAKSPAKARRG